MILILKLVKDIRKCEDVLLIGYILVKHYTLFNQVKKANIVISGMKFNEIYLLIRIFKILNC